MRDKNRQNKETSETSCFTLNQQYSAGGNMCPGDTLKRHTAGRAATGLQGAETILSSTRQPHSTEPSGHVDSAKPEKTCFKLTWYYPLVLRSPPPATRAQFFWRTQGLTNERHCSALLKGWDFSFVYVTPPCFSSRFYSFIPLNKQAK